MLIEDRSLQLAQGLCTRLCHDLAGSVGAIGTGAELLSEEGGGDPQIIGLLTDSAAAATSRLRFLRAILGVSSGRGLLPTEAKNLLAAHLTTRGAPHPPSLEWRVVGQGEDAALRRRTQLLLNLCLVALDALPRCERLAVTDQGGDSTEISANSHEEPRRHTLQGLADGLSGSGSTNDARTVQAAYTGILARSLGLTVKVDIMPGVLHLIVQKEH